jgi:chromosome segregation protein
MYLSKLEIIGFKSFAQKVHLVFDSGISAIVGPNGCGKTNIVDAIRWVLGEQRYSALRSDKMEDVIFNGTKGRKPLGMAEASLVIENTKGILPSEYAEVTVGRRVYRSGESEYLLNKVPCRLKDIQDLFMDTGMGADAYSVIELKMIETILSDKTDERRRLFEEAAGVTKYKHRRRAAYRKLEAVQSDLVRVNDIVSEIQKAVNTLERQARRAEQYNGVRTLLRDAEIDLMEREYAQYLERARPLVEKLGALREGAQGIDLDLHAEERRLDELRMVLLETEKRLAEAQRDVTLQMEKVHRVEEKNLVAAERIKALDATIARFRQEQEKLFEQQRRTGQDREVLVARLEQLQVSREQRDVDLELRRAALRVMESELEARRVEAQALNERQLGLVRDAADRQSEQDRTTTRAESLRGRIEQAAQEIVAYQAEAGRLDSEIEGSSVEDRRLRRMFTEAEVRFYDAEKQKADIRTSIEQVQRRELEVRGSIDRCRGRIDFLKGLIESGEGLSEGVRYLSSSTSWTSARHLTAADALYADDRFRVAVEAALGDFASVLLAKSRGEAERGMALLREHEKGKATFVALDRVPMITTSASLPQIPGVLGWATDIARYDPAYAALFRFLLDRTLIVEDAQAASRALGTLAGVRCVTLEGEVVTAVGVSRGGSRRQDEGGGIGKAHQIQELQRQAEELERELDDLGRARENLQRSFEIIDLKTLSDAVKAVEKEMSGIEVRIAQLVFEKKRASDIVARNTEEIRSLEEEVAAAAAQIEEARPELERILRERQEVEVSIAGLSGTIAGLEGEISTRSRIIQELGIEQATTGGEIQTGRNDLQRSEEALLAMREELATLDADIAYAGADLQAAEESIGSHDAELRALQEEHAAVERGRAAVEADAAKVRAEIHERELRIKDRRRQHDDSLRDVHDLDLKVADLQAKADHLKARALEEFELSLELKSYPEHEFVDFAALRQEIQTLRDKLRSLGNINFAAFEEYQTEKQRLEFLTVQRQDLLEAEKTLLATIEEINATAQKKFLDTFALIRTNFIETFKSLFDPGDECDLRLEEEADPLEARIEIVAKPRGKRPTSIDLLSGGEKTLTATALLFAIYLVKPSPFCILDEVDAPLDDANIDRFVRILRKFSNNTQFIVVTHNKRTMEAANALYGVTMEEEGVSKIVTVRFNESAAVASAAVATG